MARISEEILANVDIVQVISRYVQLKRAGSNFSGPCPFHNEKTPSFMVSPQKQIFKCFGCGVGGDVITFVKEIERVDFWDAVKILAPDANIDLSQYEKNYQKYEEMNQGKEKVKRLHKLAQQFFVESLAGSQEALEYLSQKRKLSPETIDTFGVWYAPNHHYDLVQQLKAKGFSDADIQESSLAKQGQSGDSYSFFRHRITFPIFDTMGNTVAFSARILDPNDKPKYLNSAEHPAFEKSKTLYGLNLVKKHIKEFNFVIVVEGQMDVIALYQLGYPIAVATCGTAITADHLKLLKRYTDNIFFLFDNDEAGQKATVRALKLAYQHDIFPKLVDLPIEFKDVDELAQTPEGKEKLQGFLDQAVDAFLAIYKRTKSRMDASSPVEKQKLMSMMFELIVGLPNPSTQIHYLSVLADEIGQSYEVMNAQYQQYVATDGKFTARQQQKNTPKSGIYQPDRSDIFASLFANNFLPEMFPDQEVVQKLQSLVEEIAKAMPESSLAQKLQTSSEEISQAQLRREKELQSASDHEDKLSIIKRIIAPSLQLMIQQLRKLPSIPAEDKHEIFVKLRELKW